MPESRLPFYVATSLFFVATGFVNFVHGDPFWVCGIGFLFLVRNLYKWNNVVTAEGILGCHTEQAAAALRFGIILFIISELIFFVSFFWAFFHSSLAPTVQIGCMWPPVGIIPILPWGEPLLNTLILVCSGFYINWAHTAIFVEEFGDVYDGLWWSTGLGFAFIFIQLNEYYFSPFTIADGIYGSTFYILTGLHGLHVLLGMVFIYLAINRANDNTFDKNRHIGLELAVWYWHFVDVVWIFVFFSVYCWGSWGFY